MDEIDRSIINRLQGGFPICPEPFAQVAAELGMDSGAIITRIEALLNAGVISRFGPLYNVEQMGGHYSLVAMRVPEEDLERVAGIVNGYAEVAHNYQRDHAFNLWFVLAVETAERKLSLLEEFAARTGYPVYDMPKVREFYVGLQLDA
jgi:DNA-binding Lrp family transcriptional regulator